MFRGVPLPIIKNFSLYTQQWYMSYRFAHSMRAGAGWNSDMSISVRGLGLNLNTSSIFNLKQNFKVCKSVHHHTFKVCKSVHHHTFKVCKSVHHHTFKVCKSVHHHTFQINQPTRCNNISKFITWRLLVCTAQHVSGVHAPIIRSSTTAVAASGFTVGVWW